MNLFAVMSLVTSIDVEFMGFNRSEPMSFAEGMVGALPVFDTREHAEAFADGNAWVMEIQTGKVE